MCAILTHTTKPRNIPTYSPQPTKPRHQKMTDRQRLHIYLSPRQARVLAAMVESEGMTRSEVIRNALDAYIEDRVEHGHFSKKLLEKLA